MAIDWTMAAVVAVVFCATLVRTVFGFGDALVAMPLLSLLLEVRVVSPLVALVATTTSVIIVGRDWRDIEFISARWLVLSSFAGIPLGILYLKNADESVVKSLLSAVVICFAIYGLRGPGALVLRTNRTGWIFGFSAGVLGGAYNAYGPPLAVYGTLRRWSPERFRANLQCCFLASGLVVVCSHALGGLWVAQVGYGYLFGLPAVPVAVFIGRRLAQRFHPAAFTRYVYGLMIAIGCMLAYQALVG